MPRFSELNQDILWKVISLETDLKSLRRTSQVCSTWRDVVVSASSLWAGAIDLTVLAPLQDEWVQEVIRRTGQELLHISAPFMLAHGAQQTAAVTILEALFKHHWKRIRTVDLCATRLDLSQEPVFKELLQQPAPRLEVFCICLSNPNTTLRLFSNDSPSLKECELSHIAFNTDTLWLRNVRQLHRCSHHGLGHERSISWHQVNFSMRYLTCHS